MSLFLIEINKNAAQRNVINFNKGHFALTATLNDNKTRLLICKVIIVKLRILMISLFRNCLSATFTK
jgi:hypothetical protein